MKDLMSEFDVHERSAGAGTAGTVHGRGRAPSVDEPSGPRAQPRPGDEPLAGELAFTDVEMRSVRGAELLARGAVVVRLETLEPSARGRLCDVIDDAIERELSARGSAAPGVGSACEPEPSLGDQLFRARRTGAKGLCIALGSLRALQAPSGALEAEDSATLRFFASATRERPIVLLLDESDARTPAFADPVPLATLLGAPMRRIVASLVETATVAIDVAVTATAVVESVALPVTPSLAAPVAPITASPTVPHETLRRAAHPERQSIGASVADPNAPWRTWALQLVAARGPQPLGAFERLFATSYVPLANALAEGLDDPRAASAHDEFRRTFERAYTEACPTFAVTGKRPKLVLDIPDIAARTARLHGARSVHLVLVDAMRFDLGAMVKTELARLLDGRALLTDEMVVWSALPTVTTRQLEGLARGIDSLRTPPTGDRDSEAVRGRTAEIVRRVKVGSRDVFKLDLVESRLKEAGLGVLAALPDLSRSVATILARHTEHLTPRTLLVVFGDHGFSLDSRGAATQGGASPEEVLVPAFTFLVGDVH